MYTTSEFAKLLNISIRTLQRWDNDGLLIANRTPRNRRYYTHEQYLEFLGKTPIAENKVGKTVVYSRVSSNSQKQDLQSQVKALEIFCLGHGFSVDEWIQEIGSGLNYQRKKFNQLFDEVEKGDISTIVIAHKDRLIRFGFDWFDDFAKKHNCEIVVVNQESLSPAEEVTQDLLSIVHCFSSRLYGLRKYKKEIVDIANTKEGEIR